MKRGTIRHPKIYRLAAILGVHHGHAVGIVQGLWEMTSDHFCDGNIAGASGPYLAEQCLYPGDGATLMKALIEARLVDKVGRAVRAVHDWWDHCETSVHNKIARAHGYFADGKMPKTTGLARGEREEIEAWYRNHGEIAPKFRRPPRETSAQFPTEAEPKPCPALPSRAEPQPPPTPADAVAKTDAKDPVSDSLDSQEGTSDSDSLRLDAQGGKGNPKNFAVVLMASLGLGRGDAKQLASDTTWFTTRCTKLLAGEYGDPKATWDTLVRAAKRIRGDPSFRSKGAAFNDWFKREIEARVGQGATNAP